MSAIIDMTGVRCGRLVATARASNIGKKTAWFCKCDCGSTIVAIAGNLRNGHTGSCGCLKSESSRDVHTTHGGAARPEYTSWQQMRQRCTNPHNPKYPLYGGRGIRVCQQWMTSFEAFFADMGSKPSPRHTIDRINNDGNYEPGNCRWATPKEQGRNRRVSSTINFRGRVIPLREACDELGLSYATVQTRRAAGASDEDALRPVKARLR